MSTTYPEYSNQFPDAIDQINLKRDPTSSEQALINQYYAKINANDWAGAQAIIDNNNLDDTVINADVLNAMIYAILSLEKFSLDAYPSYIRDAFGQSFAYSSTKKYVIPNIVLYQNQAYIAKSNSIPIGTLPTNTSYFYPITLKGEKGDSGTGLSYCGQWNSTTTYHANDCVVHYNKLWATSSTTTGSEPSQSSSVWVCVFDIGAVFVISDTAPTNQEVGGFYISHKGDNEILFHELTSSGYVERYPYNPKTDTAFQNCLHRATVTSVTNTSSTYHIWNISCPDVTSFGSLDCLVFLAPEHKTSNLTVRLKINNSSITYLLVCNQIRSNWPIAIQNVSGTYYPLNYGCSLQLRQGTTKPTSLEANEIFVQY